ncbi:MAG TPA: hypothetical protein VG099_26130, partial [Gemmataceae bacterium]|nr:hypothetical protein [Gemmataceae bacterium]
KSPPAPVAQKKSRRRRSSGRRRTSSSKEQAASDNGPTETPENLRNEADVREENDDSSPPSPGDEIPY